MRRMCYRRNAGGSYQQWPVWLWWTLISEAKRYNKKHKNRWHRHQRLFGRYEQTRCRISGSRLRREHRHLRLLQDTSKCSCIYETLQIWTLSVYIWVHSESTTFNNRTTWCGKAWLSFQSRRRRYNLSWRFHGNWRYYLSDTCIETGFLVIWWCCNLIRLLFITIIRMKNNTPYMADAYYRYTGWRKENGIALWNLVQYRLTSNYVWSCFLTVKLPLHINST